MELLMKILTITMKSISLNQLKNDPLSKLFMTVRKVQLKLS